MSKTLLGCSESVYSWTVRDAASDPDSPTAPNWVAKSSPQVSYKVRQFEVTWAPQRTFCLYLPMGALFYSILTFYMLFYIQMSLLPLLERMVG